MASSGSIWVSLGLKTDQFAKGVRNARGQLSGFQKFSAGLKNMFNPFTVGVGAIAGVTAAIADGVRIFTEFEKSASKLEAVLGDSGTAGAMLILTDQAKALGASTAFTATEVAQLQTELAKLGFDPTQIQNMTGAVLDLAAASGTELGDAAAKTGNIMNAFGLASEQAGNTADVMALAFSSSALDMEKLSETMKTAAPIAKATGVSLEDATAAAGKLADAGIDGSKAGTDLKNIFSALAKDGKPLKESLENVAKALDGASTDAEKLAIAEDLVGERAKASLLVLAENRDGLSELSAAFEEADGTAKAMADTMLDNVSGSVTKAESAYEGMVLSIEDGNGIISKTIQGVVDSFTGLLSTITRFNDTDLTMTQRFAETTNVASASMSDFDDKLLKVIGSSKSLEDLKKNGTQALTALKVAFDNGLISQEGYINQTSKIQESTKNMWKSLSGHSDVIPPMNEAIDESIGGLKKLSKEQKKLIELRNQMKEDKAAFVKVDLVSSNTDTISSVKELQKKIDTSAPKLAIPVTPQLEVDGGSDFQAEAIIEMSQGISETIAGGIEAGVAMGFGTMGEALGTALAGGDVAAIGQQFIGQIVGVMDGIGKQMIALGTAALLAKESLKSLFANPALAIGAGVALVAVSAAMSSLLSDQSTPFAEGGLVTGRVLAEIGEGRGTSKSNPEVVAPLDKLRNMINGGGGTSGEVTFRIQGSELVGILNRHSKSRNYSA